MLFFGISRFFLLPLVAYETQDIAIFPDQLTTSFSDTSPSGKGLNGYSHLRP
jgi:hypothetical protein